MKHSSLLLLSIVLSACASAPVPTPDTLDPHRAAQHFFQPIFSPMDCELVGRAGKGEIEDHFAALYFFLDRSHDRIINRAEFDNAQFNASPLEKDFIFSHMDANGDGQVTPQEYMQFAYYAFDLLDTNQDGDLTDTEVDMQSFRKAPKS